MCCRRNTHRGALIPRKRPCPEKFLVATLRYLHQIISMLYYYCNQDSCNLHRERKILQNIFVENILSKMFKWILGSLKSLISSEDSIPRFIKEENFKDYLRYVAYYFLLDPHIAFIYEKDNPYNHFSLVYLYIIIYFSGHLC